MKPMLLERKNPDINTLHYPVMVLPKLDGIRCVITEDGPKTRSLKPIPNDFVRKELSFMSPKGLDGELIIGEPNAEDVFNKTTSGIRRVKGEPDFTFWVFDDWTAGDIPYDQRMAELEYVVHDLHPRVKFLKGELVDSPEHMKEVEAKYLDMGYEGVIIRDLKGRYKQGRTTMKEHNAFKLKRFVDSEAYVIGMVPKYRNDNEAFTNELGRTARSKKAGGLVALNTMGALVLKDIESGVEFQCGSGFDDEQRLWWFNNWFEVSTSKQPVTYKKFMIGERDKPRHPIFKGLRMKEDLS